MFYFAMAGREHCEQAIAETYFACNSLTLKMPVMASRAFMKLIRTDDFPSVTPPINL